jgi:PDZ domain-containing protein
MSKKMLKKFGPIIVMFVIVITGYLYPLPYFISQPGEAIELAPIIKVQNGQTEKGAFMLTTVRMGVANIFNYSLAHFDNYKEIIPKEVLLSHYQDEEEYTLRQVQVMESSQENAILVAYRLAGLPIRVHNEGLLVTHVMRDMPSEELLRLGDIITDVNGNQFVTIEELSSYIQTIKGDKTIKVRFKREGELKEAIIPLAELPLSEEERNQVDSPRKGIGVSAMTKRRIGDVNPPIEISTKRIGGPSAGLMFTLEIYNQLIKEDLTKGYRIAGTGTISPEGNIGRIGGIHQKIVAADRAGAEFFFAPNEKGAADSNYSIALSAAKDIGTEMKVIPVDTVHDALAYLKELPARK